MKYQLMILRTKARTAGRNEINKVQKGDKRTPSEIFSITKLFSLNVNSKHVQLIIN